MPCAKSSIRKLLEDLPHRKRTALEGMRRLHLSDDDQKRYASSGSKGTFAFCLSSFKGKSLIASTSALRHRVAKTISHLLGFRILAVPLPLTPAVVHSRIQGPRTTAGVFVATRCHLSPFAVFRPAFASVCVSGRPWKLNASVYQALRAESQNDYVVALRVKQNRRVCPHPFDTQPAHHPFETRNLIVNASKLAPLLRKQTLCQSLRSEHF